MDALRATMQNNIGNKFVALTSDFSEDKYDFKV